MKTAVVLGASGAIGKECALSLLQQGIRVVAHYNNTPLSAQDFGELGNRAVTIKADLSRESGFSPLIPYLKGADILIHAVGAPLFSLVQNTSRSQLSSLIDLNLSSAFTAASLAVPSMVERQSGKIIFISSIWGGVGASFESAYSLTKAALNGLTLSLAKELAPSNINVNAIAAGVIDTPMNSALTSQALADLAHQTPLGRLGAAKDIASLACFLASEGANFITGQIITCDGGFTL